MISTIRAELKEKIAAIKVIITDVDGVLTDAGVYLDQDGNEAFARFNIQDGYGFVIAHDCNLKIAVISGRKSLCAEARCRSLGIEHYYTGVRDKHAKLVEILDSMGLVFKDALYIGDDIIDLKAMNSCSVKIAPQNARNMVKDHADYVTAASGGFGAFREVVDLVLETQGVYPTYLNNYL